MNHRAKRDAASFILGGEIRKLTNKQKTHASLSSNRHFDRFSRFFRARERVQQTYKDHATQSVVRYDTIRYDRVDLRALKS